MKVSTILGGASALFLLALETRAVHSSVDNQQLFFGSHQPATFSWLQQTVSKISSWLQHPKPFHQPVDFDTWTHSIFQGDNQKTILEIILDSDEFSQLAHVLRYASKSTREILNSTSNSLTFFAPKNWHHRRHAGGGNLDAEQPIQGFNLVPASIQYWRQMENKMADFEKDYGVDPGHQEGNDDDDDQDKKRRRAIIRQLADAEILYHLVRSDQVMDFKSLADNSSVATWLNTGCAYEFNDGTDWRIRTGKSLLPIAGIYLNFYSRVIQPNINAKNGLVHAIQFPLILPPDILQSLFYGQTVFSTSTSALQKIDAAKHLSYRPCPSKHPDKDVRYAAELCGKGPSPHPDFNGVAAQTFFVATNLAWRRLPVILRTYLFSPWGYHLLEKVWMLHSLPSDIVYADFVHHVKPKHVDGDGHDDGKGDGVEDDDSIKLRPHKECISSTVNKTCYTFDTLLADLDGTEGKYETVDVEVFRYYLLPGNLGPLQTRITVQNVSVTFQDIPAANGVYHAMDKFIKPRGHPHRGVWAEIAREAELAGFGKVDLEKEGIANLW